MLEKIGRWISRYPWAAIIIVLLITLLSIASVATFGLKQEFSEETFMPDLEEVKANQEILNNFTSTYDVTILVKSKNGDLLTKNALIEMLKIEKNIANSSLREKLYTPFMPSYSIGSVADIIAQFILQQKGIENPTYDEKIAALQQMDDSQIKNVIKNFLTNPFAPADIKAMFTMSLTKDFNLSNLKAKGSIIRVSFNYTIGKDDKLALETERRLDEIVKSMNYAAIDAYVMGEQIVVDEIMKANNESMKILLPLALLMVIIILAIIYRDVIDMLVSLLALVFAIIWMYGFGAAMHYSFNPITTAIPVLLVGLGIDYGIHLTMRYREERQSRSSGEAVENTVKHIGMGLLLATITTVVAFLSNLTSPIDLLGEFGILAAVGIIASFITMILFVPSCKYLRDRSKEMRGSKEKREGDALNKAMAKAAVALEKHGKTVIAVTIVATIFMGYYAMQLSTTFDIKDFLPEKLEITKNLRFMMDEFEIAGGTAEEAYILVKENVAKPDTLRKMAQCIYNMKDDEYVVKIDGNAKAMSILSLMSDYASYQGFGDLRYNETFATLYNKYFENGLPKENVSEENITLLYSWLYLNAPMDAKMVLHKSSYYDEAVIRVEVNTERKEERVDELYNDLKEDIKPLNGSAVVTGGEILAKIIMDLINESQIRSLITTLISCLAILAIIFYIKDKSAILGVLTLIPVALCVIWILGSMYLFGIPLNVMTLSIASLTIGLGVTYGIHISHRFAEEIKDKDIDEACRNTIAHTGSALFGAAATTIAGFGLLVFALMPPLQQFGGITALTILYSFISSTFILPSLLAIWARIRKRREIS